MNIFLKKMMIFILSILILIIPLDFFISAGLKKSQTFARGEIKPWLDIYSNNITAEIIIHGSSRACYHVDPNIIEKIIMKTTYNLGIEGHNFWLQKFRHQEFIKYNPPPKFIILAVGTSTLKKRTNLYNSNQFLPFMLWNKDMWNATKSYIGFDIFDFIIPLIRYQGNYLSILESFKNLIYQSSKEIGRINGFKGIDKKWKKVEKKNSEFYTVDIDNSTVELLESFIVDTKKNNIKLIVVYTPEHIEGQKNIINRNEIVFIFNSLTKKHNVSYLDYSNSNICMNKKYFYNGNHLNKIGAKVFTKKLAKDLKKLILN